MADTVLNLIWSLVFSLVGGIAGIILVMISTAFIPRLLDKLTPNIDENKEIARGNQAVAEYYGRVVAAAVTGVSVVIAAAVLGGIIAALH